MPSSGWMCWKYMAVYGCVRALMTAVVAVTVAVRDTRPTFRSQGGSRSRAPSSGLTPSIDGHLICGPG
jgi:hypothetical protein